MAAVTICSDFGAQKNKVSNCFHCLPSICREVNIVGNSEINNMQTILKNYLIYLGLSLLISK